MSKKREVLARLFLECQNKGEYIIDRKDVRRVCDEVDFGNQFDVTKVDRSSLYPDVMKQGTGYFIAHLGKGRHQFVPNQSLAYHPFEAIDQAETGVWEYVPSILNDFDSSEANILSVAYNQLILHDFLYGDRRANPEIYLARRTKFTGEYTIDSQPISVTQVQLEMDMALEWNGDVTIMEAKNGFHDDFAVYQLFHPYLYFDHFRRRGTLDIKGIQCCYLQRRKRKGISTLRLHLYRFYERDLSLIELVRKREYVLERRDPL